MEERVLIALVAVLVLGVGAQWIAWRMRVPAILLLLAAGVVAGPITGWLRPDEAFGRDVLLSFVSLGVAVILFEGALTLKWEELKRTGAVVPLLVTVGLLITWVVASAAAVAIAGFDLNLALLWGALMTVSGPTVIMPLLRQMRPTANVRSVLKWEAIVVDPLGAVLAIVVFELAFVSQSFGWQSASLLLLELFGAGIGVGLAGAALVVIGLRRFWGPDHLHIPFTLALVAGVFAASNWLFAESGLLAVTVMGLAMANQKLVKVEHILEFKENLRVLLISMLFVLLAARLDPGLARTIGPESLLVVCVLVLVGRPLAVFASTAFSKLSWPERTVLAGVMPRGIVAAAISTVFALRLEALGFPGGQELAAYAILAVVATVIVYGLGSGSLARWLGVADSNPQGVLFAGANDVALALAKPLKELGFRVLLVDLDWAKVLRARRDGLEAMQGDILDEHVSLDLDLRGLGSFVAATSSSRVDDLAVLHWQPFFGRERTFRLAQDENGNAGTGSARHGRVLLGDAAPYGVLASMISSGGSVRAVPAGDGQAVPEQAARILAFVRGKTLRLVGSGTAATAAKADTLIVLADAESAPTDSVERTIER